MAIGSGIFLIVVGAILTFALNTSVDAVNLGAVGWICMIAGVAAIVISLIVNAQRANTTHREIRDEHAVRDDHHVEHPAPEQ
ncbi:DUF6458 family protein [Demequina capsici]|uniref:DUF6458 family protein n=1 Tax=Demequina capsici TaxID=3075620 RepID=A0AA96J7G4_9MICO|nr:MULTISPECIES: DUF6458 family protein [unclassified Demequina]WNM24330.1 DUF6458 family protein [Demequina sp. OYTSA14]WNM27152.1 DUF6458 family protein [Demequina sp. PMTSA13]